MKLNYLTYFIFIIFSIIDTNDETKRNMRNPSIVAFLRFIIASHFIFYFYLNYY